MSDDLVRYRSRFPVLRERSYFTAPCLGPFLDETLEDFDEYRRTLFLRNRSLELWVERMYELSGLVERLLNAPPNSVALRDSATACQAAVAAAVEPNSARNRIVTAPSLDFRSTRYLWTAQVQRGFTLDEVGQGKAWVSAEEWCSKIDERTAIVALPLVSPQTGALAPAAKILEHARQMGAITVVDAYQALGIVNVDVQALGADVVVGGTHKWMCGGGMGLAFMFVEPGLATRLEPKYPGWIGHRDLTSATRAFEPASGARRFQQGTPAMEPIYTARAGVRFLLEVGVESLRRRSLELTERVVELCKELDIPVSTPTEADRRGGMVCLSIQEADRIAQALSGEAIDVDARPDAGLRIGPFPCLEVSECEHVVRRIAALMGR